MQLVGSRGQIVRDFTYDASGTITAGGTPQLVVPEHAYRTSLFIQNISSSAMYIEIGGARATASLTGNVVTSVAITNGGFGYTLPPLVYFLGGGDRTRNPSYLCPGLPGNLSPSATALGTSTLTGGVVTSVTISNGGNNYVKAPYVFLRSHENDPYGVASPFYSSTVSGALLTANGGSLYFNGTVQTTDAFAIYCATTGAAFTCKYTIGG